METRKDTYKGLRLAEDLFKHISNVPPLICRDTNLIALAVMRLIIKYGYTLSFTDGKFTILYTVMSELGLFTFTIVKSISLLDSKNNVYQAHNCMIKFLEMVVSKAKDYDKSEMYALNVKFYFIDMEDNGVFMIGNDLHKKLWDLAPADGYALGEANPMIRRKNKKHVDYLTKLKPSDKERGSFIVADSETVVVDMKHVPYAIGFLVVRPGDDISSKKDNEFESYFSEDYRFF